jgi:hypothetical protein
MQSSTCTVHDVSGAGDPLDLAAAGVSAVLGGAAEKGDGLGAVEGVGVAVGFLGQNGGLKRSIDDFPDGAGFEFPGSAGDGDGPQPVQNRGLSSVRLAGGDGDGLFGGGLGITIEGHGPVGVLDALDAAFIGAAGEVLGDGDQVIGGVPGRARGLAADFAAFGGGENVVGAGDFVAQEPFNYGSGAPGFERPIVTRPTHGNVKEFINAALIFGSSRGIV